MLFDRAVDLAKHPLPRGIAGYDLLCHLSHVLPDSAIACLVPTPAHIHAWSAQQSTPESGDEIPCVTGSSIVRHGVVRRAAEAKAIHDDSGTGGRGGGIGDDVGR